MTALRTDVRPADASPVVVQGLVKSFPGPKRGLFAPRERLCALAGVDFSVPAGALVALCGPDGAGKTTLLRILCGILSPDPETKELSVLGRTPDTDDPSFVGRLGFMPQKFGLYEELTVAENMTLFGALKGVRGKALRQRFADLMTLTGLSGFESRPAGKLSGGMKQKLGLAAALLSEPELLILDEPTVGVDPLSRRELWRIIEAMRTRSGLTCLVSTSYLDEAARADLVLLLEKGRLIAQGAPSTLAERAAGRTFFAQAEPRRAAELSRRLQFAVRAADPDAPFWDARPEGERVRLLAADSCTETAVRAADLVRRCGGAVFKPREPTLEDAYCALTFAGKPKAAAARLEDSSERTAERPDAGAGTPTTTEPSVVIRADRIGMRFGRFEAVADTSFTVKRGEIFGLLGPNGAGKTTTFRMLCGLLKPTAGTLSVAGADLRSAPARARARVGYVAQKFSLYERLTAEDNLRYFGQCFGASGRTLERRIQRICAQTELINELHRPASQLPLGAKRELAMAAALIHSPEVLFLDEPTSGADVASRRDFWRRIVGLAQAGTTVIVTTHFMEEAEYCDRILIQDAGRVLVVGSPHSVRADAKADSIEEAFVEIVEAHRRRDAGSSS